MKLRFDIVTLKIQSFYTWKDNYLTHSTLRASQKLSKYLLEISALAD